MEGSQAEEEEEGPTSPAVGPEEEEAGKARAKPGMTGTILVSTRRLFGRPELEGGVEVEREAGAELEVEVELELEVEVEVEGEPELEAEPVFPVKNSLMKSRRNMENSTYSVV